MRFGIAFLLVAGCGYRPGSFSGRSPYAGMRSTVGCLDLAIARRDDLPEAAVIDYQFGNRCTTAVPVDFSTVAVVARTRDGAEVRLAPYDPQHEITAQRLDGRLEGREVIAYPVTDEVVQVCVDTASLARVEPARWVCFGNRASRLAEVQP
jgi:hypothetical protein